MLSRQVGAAMEVSIKSLLNNKENIFSIVKYYFIQCNFDDTIP